MKKAQGLSVRIVVSNEDNNKAMISKLTMYQIPTLRENTKKRVVQWILYLVLIFFPVVWLIQPMADVPLSSTAIQVENGTMHVDSRWLSPPGALERYGTDPLGRNVIPFVKESIGQVIRIVLGAALIRTLLGRLFSKVKFLQNLPPWAVFPAEIVLFGLVLSLPHFRTGVPGDHTLLLAVLLGLYFLPACREDLSPRQMGLTFLNQMMRILVVITLMGLLGANPYEAISAAYPVTFTYPA